MLEVKWPEGYENMWGFSTLNNWSSICRISNHKHSVIIAGGLNNPISFNLDTLTFDNIDLEGINYFKEDVYFKNIGRSGSKLILFGK